MTSSVSFPLGEVAEFIRGINFKPDDVVPVGTEGTVACMRTKNVQELLDCDDVWGVPKDFVRRSNQILQEGDVLVSSANSWNLVGKCCWIPKLPWEASFGGFVSVLRANDTVADPRYVYRWFSSDRIQALLRSFGQKTTNISNLNIDRCLNLSISLPSLPEQRRIAAILDQADALRAKRREALAQIDSLTQSIFIEMFGDPATNPKVWPVTRLDSEVSVIGGYAFKSSDYVQSGIPLIRIGEVNRGGFSKESACFLPNSFGKDYARFLVHPGDLLMSLTGTTGKDDYGNVTVLGAEYEDYLLNQRVASIKPRSGRVLKDYLVNFLGNKKIKGEIISKSRGVRQANISNSDILELGLPLPPVEKQLEFQQSCRFVAGLSATEACSLSNLEALFTTLQHRAFRGEL